ncbi:MAG TPA: hypothetical protein VLR89_07415 [Anaerolineaceae bacterium]|nr:hypothetical protein [Anaerolineaceae bacterium]
MMRKLAVVVILVLLVLLVIIPSEVRAALIQGKEPELFQQVGSAYPGDQGTNTNNIGSIYPINSGTPPTASFGTVTQTTTRTLTFTPTRTVYRTTEFATATSSYANTAAAIRTAEALTIQALTRISPLYTPGTPSPSPVESETPTTTGTSMPSWTTTPSITDYPTVITTPRVLARGGTDTLANFRFLLFGLGFLSLACFLIVGFWFFFKRH